MDTPPPTLPYHSTNPAWAPNAIVYRLQPNAFRLSFRQRLTAILLVALAFAILPALYWSAIPPQDRSAFFLVGLLPILAALVLAFFTPRRQKDLSAFRVVLTPDDISCVTDHGIQRHLARTQIAVIEESAKGLHVYAATPGNALFLPRPLENYDDLRQRLQQYTPITPANPYRGIRLCLASCLVALALFALVNDPSPRTAAFTVPIILALLPALAWHICRSSRTTRANKVLIVLLTLAAAAILITFAASILTTPSPPDPPPPQLPP